MTDTPLSDDKEEPTFPLPSPSSAGNSRNIHAARARRRGISAPPWPIAIFNPPHPHPQCSVLFGKHSGYPLSCAAAGLVSLRAIYGPPPAPELRRRRLSALVASARRTNG